VLLIQVRSGHKRLCQVTSGYYRLGRLGQVSPG